MYDVYYLLNCTRRSFQLLVGFSYREMAPPPSKRRCLKVSRKPLGTRSLFLLARFALNIAQCLLFRIQFLFSYCLSVCLVIWHTQKRNVCVPPKPPINNEQYLFFRILFFQKIISYCLFDLGFGHFGHLASLNGGCFGSLAEKRNWYNLF